tara:strand:+ start:76 stop:387 length:312 start_codon:yes stop_codon:yes gene_type:complete
MIQEKNNEISYIDSPILAKKETTLLNEMMGLKQDIIINCSVSLPTESFLNDISIYQKKIKKSFVLIIPIGKKDLINLELNIVPTKKEAFDFICFEQMQRDIGF